MASTSTSPHSALLEEALAGVPDAKLRSRLIESYLQLKRANLEARYDLAGLNTGKFCEVALRVAQHRVLGTSTPLGKRIANFADECRALVTSPAASAPESIREIIPRALVFLYTVRNKRGIGHVGGDVDANRVDAITMVQTADWIVCELIRLFHGLSLEEAQDIVDALSTRQLPLIWEVGGKKRVLRTGLSAADEVLLLLYAEKQTSVLTEDLCAWVEYSNPSVFRRKVLQKLHTERLVEYDTESELVHLSPKGVAKVEAELLRPDA